MGSSIFADESGDESAREQRANDRRRSVFRRRDGDGAEPTADDAVEAHDDDERSAAGDGSDDARSASGDESGSDDDRTTGGGEGGTMRVFSGSEVFEVSVDDE